jgi:cell division septation protein DedD
LDKKLVPQTDSDKLKAFVQKMQNEGAAGFAAGPWSISPGGTATARTAGSSYSRRPSRIHRFVTSGRRLTDRILSGLALLSLSAIIVGIIGIYLTEEPGQPIVATGDTGTVPAPHQADGKQLHEIRQKLLITTNRLDSLAAEFRRLKHHAKTAVTDVKRLQALENRLVLTVTRLDTLSAEILDLKQANNVILAATTAAPPAAIPLEARIPTHSRTLTMSPMQRTPVVAPLVPEELQHVAADPAPAPIPAYDPLPEPVPETVMAVNPTSEPKPEAITAVSASVEPIPETVAAVSTAPEPLPETIATISPAPEPAPAQTHHTAGDWVVNIASYNRQKTATRYVTELQQAGIPAEQVQVTVNGRRIHRVRVAGLATRAAARTRAGALKQELGLPDIWIGKR